ncbi:MAG: ABC transporter ATP-binding protein, partial [Planctomycetes bacterium]|nr:ABC transporter ATP-binding protein [Planctomycetota bacterium]
MIKRLAQSIREYRRDSLLAPIFVALEVVMDVIIPFLMARIIDRGIAASSMQTIEYIGILLVLSALLSLFFGVTAGKHAAIASAGFAHNLRRDMYHNIQGFSFSNIDRFSTASLVTRLTTDVTNVQVAYQMLLRILVRSPLMLVFSLAMAFKVNNTAALIFLGVAPVLGVGLYFIVSRAHPIFVRVIRIYDRLNTVVRENLRGIRVVKAYVREDHEIEKFTDVSTDIYRGYSAAQKLMALNSPLMQFAMYSCTLLLSYVGAKLIVVNSMTTGQLMGLLTYASQILMSLNMLSMVLVMITVSRASAQRIVEVLDERSDLTSPAKPATAVQDGSIEFKHVAFGYAGSDHVLCLNDIDFTIKSGETVGIIGGTGSGKTTLVQLIPRLYDVTEGAVLVGGVDVRQYDLDVLRSQVSVVLQKNVLFSGTIAENLRWGDKNATDEQLRRA